MELLEESVDTPAVGFPQQFFEDLYERAFPAFARAAARMRPSMEDARDVFHDALIIYYEKSRTPGFEIRVSPEAYVVGIAKHLLVRKFKADRHKVSFSDVESTICIPSDFYPAVNETGLLRFLEKSGKKCLELLRRFYYEKDSMKLLADSLGFSSEHSASVQKHKCIGKLRQVIKSKTMHYEDFLF